MVEANRSEPDRRHPAAVFVALNLTLGSARIECRVLLLIEGAERFGRFGWVVG